MITEDLLKLHDELELKTTARPWASVIRRRAGYGSLIFWSRKVGLEVLFDNASDARYLTFIRNICPELVKEVRALKMKIEELQAELIELSGRSKDV